MAKNVSDEEIMKLPYVERLPEPGRLVELRSFYDHEESDWFLYVEVREGELGRMAGGEVASGSYFSIRPQDAERDFPAPVSSVVAKHLSFPGVSTITTRLESDLHQMAAVLGKYHLIMNTTDLDEAERRALLETELWS